MAQWYRLESSVYLTEEQADKVGREWASALLTTLNKILPDTGPVFYIADGSMKPEVENADD